MNDTSIFTIKDMQNYLQISRSKAYQLTKIPHFPIIRIGKDIRIIKGDLDNWLHNQKNNDIFA